MPVSNRRTMRNGSEVSKPYEIAPVTMPSALKVTATPISTTNAGRPVTINRMTTSASIKRPVASIPLWRARGPGDVEQSLGQRQQCQQQGAHLDDEVPWRIGFGEGFEGADRAPHERRAGDQHEHRPRYDAEKRSRLADAAASRPAKP